MGSLGSNPAPQESGERRVSHSDPSLWLSSSAPGSICYGKGDGDTEHTFGISSSPERENIIYAGLISQKSEDVQIAHLK